MLNSRAKTINAEAVRQFLATEDENIEKGITANPVTNFGQEGISKVYVITTADFRPVKIGISIRVQIRLAELQPGYWNKLHIFAVIIPRALAAHELESAFHRYFTKLRLNGEWFDMGAENALKALNLMNKI